MKLYYAPGACSLAPHMVLREAGLDFTLEKVDLKAHQTETGGDYYAVNPKGYVPALQVDGQLLTEAAVILQYLADQKPAAKLIPPNGTLERYRVQEWLNFISTEVHKPLGSFFSPTLHADTRKATEEKLASRFDYLSKQLDGKPYLMGEQFTVADAYLDTILNWTRPLKVDLSKWRTLLDYMKRVASRPAVQQALKAEGLIK